MKIKDLFDVEYPKTLIFADQTIDEEGINFVSSSANNNGIVDRVALNLKNKVYPEGVITVPLKGSVLNAFIQPEECYIAHQIAVLIPKKKMSIQEKFFYCFAIRKNKFRYNFGRQADKSLENLDVPSIDKIPKWINNTFFSFSLEKDPALNKDFKLKTKEWKYFLLKDLFKIEKGRETFKDNKNGKFAFISATKENNGVTDLVSVGNKIFKGNSITVPSNGASTGEAFYQEKEYLATGDVNILIPKFELNKYLALFLTTIIRLEKYKFSYGRKWGKERMLESEIKLPKNKDENPDWKFMENYIKSLPYSRALENIK